ncbi:MAG: gamma-glutamylcyclotransferase [Anaerolineae bacterium]|nr:gamma-glutamylcyclotransferase [Anaerolineae bacterium]
MESLFVYGTLQDPQVQSTVFGRVVEGSQDSLVGYRKSEISIDNIVYPIAVADIAHTLPGKVIEVTPKELVEIDRYEGEDYRRIQVRLRSGRTAWVYCE